MVTRHWHFSSRLTHFWMVYEGVLCLTMIAAVAVFFGYTTSLAVTTKLSVGCGAARARLGLGAVRGAAAQSLGQTNGPRCAGVLCPGAQVPCL